MTSPDSPRRDEADDRLRDLIDGRLPESEAAALHRQLLDDPRLSRRFARLFAERGGDPAPERRPADALPSAVTSLRGAARTRAIDELVTALDDRLRLPLARSLPVAVVGGTDVERVGALDRVEARARSGGLRPRRRHAGLEPFVFPARVEDAALLLDEALCAPGLADRLVTERRAVLLTVDEAGWQAEPAGSLLARCFRLPDPAPPAAETAASPAGRLAAALGEWGIPVPLRLLAAVSGLPADGLVEPLTATGLFDLDESGPGPALRPGDARRLGRWLARAGDGAERRSRLEALAAAATAEESGTLVALLTRLAALGQRGLGHALARTLGPRLPGLLGADVRVVVAWARALAAVGSLGLAAGVLDQGDDRAPDDPALARERALLLAAGGDVGDACRRLAALDARQPRDVAVLHTWARIELDRGAPGRARSLLEAALADDPANPHLLIALGRAVAAQDGAPTADPVFAQALEAAPGVAGVLVAWAQVAAAAGRVEEAVARLERAAAMEPWNVRPLLDLAALHREPAPWLRRALRRAPHAGPARERWRALLDRSGRMLEATRWEPAPLPAAALAAAPAGAVGSRWVVYREGDAWVALTVTADGELLASVEQAGAPVEGALVTVLELDASGSHVERTAGVTDARGEAGLGPVEALSSLLPPAGGERWRVRVVLPPGD